MISKERLFFSVDKIVELLITLSLNFKIQEATLRVPVHVPLYRKIGHGNSYLVLKVFLMRVLQMDMFHYIKIYIDLIYLRSFLSKYTVQTFGEFYAQQP